MMTEEQKKLYLHMGTATQSAQLLSQAARIGKSLGWSVEKSIDVLLEDLKEYRKSNTFDNLLKKFEKEDKQ